METEYWYDQEHTYWTSQSCDGLLCEECEDDQEAVVEVKAWPMGDEHCGWRALCQTHYEALRQAPAHNPKGGHADAYVGLGEAL